MRMLAAVLLIAVVMACAPPAAWADDPSATGRTDVTVVRPPEDNIQETVAVGNGAKTQKLSAIPKTGDAALAASICVSAGFVLFSAAVAGVALRNSSKRGSDKSRKEVSYGKE